MECCNKGLRASLTPHWRELCVALSPGVVAKEVDDGRTLRYRRLYWQLHVTATGALLKPHATYTLLADVTLRSHCGEHVCVFSAAFSWRPQNHDDTEMDLDHTSEEPSERQYLLRPSWEHTSVSSEVAEHVTGPFVDADCKVRVCRDDGAVAYLPWCCDWREHSGPIAVAAGRVAADPRAVWKLDFGADLSSDMQTQRTDRMDMDLTLHLCAAEAPTEGQEHPSRLRVIQRHNPEDLGSMCSPQLFVGYGRTPEQLFERVTYALESQLAWAPAVD